MNLAQIWYKHKKIILIVGANVAGLAVILIVATILYRSSVVPDMPDPETASAKAVVKCISDRNFSKLSARNRRDYFDRVTRLSPSRREGLAQQLDRLRPKEVIQLQNNVFRMLVEDIRQESKEYRRLGDRKARQKYIERKMAQRKQTLNVLSGADVRRTSGKAQAGRVDLRRPNLARGISQDPVKLYTRVLNNTSPGERAQVETYVDDLRIAYERERPQR